jgi:hypothetical protein
MPTRQGSWDALHARYDVRRINHTLAFSDEGACTNQAESFFSRLRRAEWGQHHHISGATSAPMPRDGLAGGHPAPGDGTLHGLATAAAHRASGVASVGGFTGSGDARHNQPRNTAKLRYHAE